jgi:chromosome condensin MukBEF MukE localization factor
MNADYKPLWDKLRLGYHVSPRDGVLHDTLCDPQRGEEVRELLAKLGYELVHHPRGFFYLAGETDEFLKQKRLSSSSMHLARRATPNRCFFPQTASPSIRTRFRSLAAIGTAASWSRFR